MKKRVDRTRHNGRLTKRRDGPYRASGRRKTAKKIQDSAAKIAVALVSGLLTATKAKNATQSKHSTMSFQAALEAHTPSATPAWNVCSQNASSAKLPLKMRDGFILV